MHYVKRAIIMAAGYGSRMYPLTKTTPKPLIKVNGVRMIDNIIDALHKNEIYEIYVVVGYMKEKFYEWVKLYPGIKLIENPYYKDCNNISSLYVARDYIEDSIIMDGDQVIYNSDVLHREFIRSGYNVTWQEEETDEWLLKAKDDIIISCSRTGGKKGWRLYSVSRWTKDDGSKLKHHLELEFNINGNREIYWDDVAMFCHRDEYELGICKMGENDITEIDSIDELINIDNSYRKEEK